MSELFAEATVHLTPDLTGFISELESKVKAAVLSVEKKPAAKLKISPALTRDFVGNLRKQVNIAVAQAQRGVKPIQVRAVLSDVSRSAIAREVRAGAQTVRATTPAAGGAGVVSSTTRAAAVGNDAFAASQARVNNLVGRGAILLDEHVAAIEADAAATQLANKARTQALNAGIQSTNEMVQETAAAQALALAKRELATANLAEAGSSQRAAGIRAADLAARRAIVLAIEEQDLATRHAAEGFRTSLRTQAGANAALNETSRAARQAASNMSQLRRGVLSTSLSFLGIRGATLAASARFLAGAAAIAVFAKALQSASEFATQLNVFRATTAATGDELDRVRDAARALGVDLKLPGVTAQDAAESMTELAKAGLGVEDSIAGARGVLQLATAAAIDNAQAVELAANAINAFGLAGADATHVADVFANAANAAQGSIVDIGIAFQQASAAGRQVGLSFEDTSEFLTVLARNGLKGSDAGTSLRTALIRLVKPTKEAAAELKNLGIETRDASGNLRPDVFIQLAEATKGLSPAARDAKIALIGGQDAFRAFTILGRQSIDDFIALRKELRQQGTAADLAAARMTGLRGALEGLSNTLSGIGIRTGASLTPALQGVVVGVTGATQGLSESTTAAQLFSTWVDALSFELSALGKALQLVGAVALPVASALATITSAVGGPTIVTAVLAYLTLGKALGGVAAVMKSTQIATLSVAAAMRPATFATTALRVGMSSLASALPLVQIGIAAAVAGLFLLITREHEGERAARRLTEATEGLIAAQEKLRTSSAAARDTELGVSGAQLGVLEAQQRQAQARAALNTSTAGEGTFARTKLLLELKVATDNVAIAAQNALGDAVKAANEALDESRQAALNAVTAHETEAKALLDLADAARSGSLGFTPERDRELGLTKLVGQELEKRAQAAREENTEESRGFARRLELLKSISTAVGKLPTAKAIDITVNAPNLNAVQQQLLEEFGTTGDKLREALFSSLTQLDTSPEVTAAIIDLARKLGITLVTDGREAARQGADAITTTLAGGIDQGAPKVLSAVDRLMAQIKESLGRASGLDVQENLATIASGATGATLPVLQQKLAEARGREADARAAIAASLAAGGPGETPNIRKALRQAIADQAALITQIRGINTSLASDAKAAADDAKTKQDQIFDNILKAMGIRRDARQQAIEDAQLTEGAGDDLSATRKLRRLVNVQIEHIQERIRAARKEGLDVSTLIAGLRVLEGIYRELGRTVKDLQDTRRQEIKDRIAESISLDIANAQITENRTAEIRARNREIARLKALQAKTKAGTVEYKRLRNLINEQLKALEELGAADKNSKDALLSLQKQEFEFLQRIQGFTGNLLGNLIPGGITGGLVGGVAGAPSGGASPLTPGPFNQGGVDPLTGRPFRESGGVSSAALLKAQTATDAVKDKGFTAGQGNRTNHLLMQILKAVNQFNRGSDHPEAKQQRKSGSAALDVGSSHGSTHGM